MIDHVCAATVEYIDHMPKIQKEEIYGQFFTSKETAVFMAGAFFRFPKVALLSASSIRVLAQEFSRLHSLNDWSQTPRLIPLSWFAMKNDANIVDLLYSNLEWACSHTTKKVSF